MIIRNKKGQFVKNSHWREKKLCWDKNWLYKQYITNKFTAAEIAIECNIGLSGVLYWLKKHNITCRSMSEIRKQKYWGLSNDKNPMWNKYGKLNPHWLGGITPERQMFYMSREWKTACSAVWKRDNAICQRCKVKKNILQYHFIYIISNLLQ